MKIIADIPDNILSAINDNDGLISSEQLAILQKSIMDGAACFDSPKYVIKVNTTVDAQTIADELKRQEALGVIFPNEYEIERLNILRGKWIEVPVKRDILHPNGIKYVCSACKRDNCYGKPPFCMWCGATMILEEEEQHESQ